MDVPQGELSDIQRFYKGGTVFLTGGTGFIGKLLLEKVLRALPVRKVFILVRNKKQVPVSKRVQEIFESPIFDGLKRSSPDVFQKVVTMEGDCSLPILGLSDQNVETIIKEVDVIFHCAASIRFDEHLKKATRTNVVATRDLVQLAKKIKKLRTFVYVGTAFANSNKKEIKEEIYPPKIQAEKLIAACESLDDDTIQSMTKTLVGDWPNNYTFTKQVVEDYIQREAQGIPICITRPTIVVSTSVEPVSAFVDNVFTLAGFVLATGLGISRITYYKNTVLDVVPADYVVNECIAAGWNTGETYRKQRTEVPIYNISTGLDNPITQDEIYDLNDYYGRQVPSTKVVAFPLFFRTTCKYNYLLLRFFFHSLLAMFGDAALRLQGKKPMYAAGIKRLHDFQEAYEYFYTNSFFIHVENTHRLLRRMSFKDRELFNCDMGTINWEAYFSQYIKGLRIYMVKDPMNTLPEGIKHVEYLKKVLIAVVVVAVVVAYVTGKILLFRVLPFVFGIVIYTLRSLVCQ